MFFAISKTLGFLSHPLFFLLIVAVLGFILKKKILVYGAFACLWLVSTPAVSDLLLSLIEYPAKELPAGETFPVAVVLGGIIDLDHDERAVPDFFESADRILNGIELVHKGTAEKLLFTGGSGDIMNRDASEGLKIEAWLENQIPEDSILMETKSRNTWENAVFSKELIQKNADGRPVLLITSAFHMRRSLACFIKAGIPAIPYAVDYRQINTRGVYEWLPDEEALRNSYIVVKEFSGIVAYRIRGYN